MPTSKKKTKQVAIRLSEEEYERLLVLARLDGRSMSSWLRRQISVRSDAKRKKNAR